MKSILILTLLAICHVTYTQNPYIGEWVMYDIKSFKDHDTISDDQKKNFDSSIIFNENMTFIKTTNGNTITGKYEYTSNKFKFLEKNAQGEYYVSWTIRWPRKTEDPLPETSAFDLCYPEIFMINGQAAELDVYYIKQNE